MEKEITIETPSEMRIHYFPSLSDGQENTLKEYFANMTVRGITLNPKLYPSKFHLNNGLPYIGMATKDLIKGGEVLIRVPEDLILSADKAFVEPALIEIYKDHFFLQPKDHQKQEDTIDEDKVIIIYALFILSKREQNDHWYQMIKNFPEECDTACFWPSEQLDEIVDKTVKSGAEIALKSFQKQWNQFEELQRKYQLLQKQGFSKHNYRRVYITLSNRAFGFRVKYISLVPLAEYFNHHSSKVKYSLENKKETYLSEERDEDSQTSSIGSCDSFQFFEQGEFDYDQLQIMPSDWTPAQIADLSIQEKDKVIKEFTFFIHSLDDLLNWKDFTIIFIAHIIQTARTIEKSYLEGRKNFEKVMMDIKVLKKSVDKYKIQVSQYYKSFKNKEYLEKETPKLPYDKFQFKEPQKLYESLILKTSSSDKFEANNQVYFRYGYKCNRCLLLHYGFAIRGNKYDHSCMSFNLGDCLNEFPDVLQKIKEKKLSLMRKFKVYHHRLNLDMIIFFRLNSWTFYGENAIDDIFKVTDPERECAILQQILSIIEQYAQLYEGEYDLTDKSLGYHQYFITVYHLQKLTIFKKQIKMIKLLIQIMKQLEEGYTLKEASKKLSKSEREVLKPYFSTIKI